jgi:uncharacterized protein (DUF1697 family)
LSTVYTRLRWERYAHPVTRYVALLRGINVGGRNPIRMTALRSCFLDHGFADVSTYIQSGNVVFSARREARPALVARIERMLAESFVYEASVVVKSAREMRTVVTGAPERFGTDPSRYRYDVLFLKPPLTARSAIHEVPIKDGVDEAAAGNGVLYFSRLTSRATQSRLSRIAAMPIYRNLTIRNWNTTTRLADLVVGGSSDLELPERR